MCFLSDEYDAMMLPSCYACICPGGQTSMITPSGILSSVCYYAIGFFVLTAREQRGLAHAVQPTSHKPLLLLALVPIALLQQGNFQLPEASMYRSSHIRNSIPAGPHISWNG